MPYRVVLHHGWAWEVEFVRRVEEGRGEFPSRVVLRLRKSSRHRQKMGLAQRL